MNPETIKNILYIIIIIAIVGFLIKKSIKIAFVVAAVLFLFNIGYRFTGEDINNELKVNEYFSEGASNAITAFFDDFDAKRDEYGVVDTDKVYEDTTEAIKHGATVVIEGLGTLDIDKFATVLADKIYDAGETLVNETELFDKIKEEIGNISDEDIQKIVDTVSDALENKEETVENTGTNTVKE